MHAFALLLSAAAAMPADPAQASVPPQPSSDRQPSDLQALQWLAGHWRDGAGTEEVWLQPAGGVMPGLNRSIGPSGARVEQLRIEARAGKLVYVATPDGQPTTEFTASAVSAGEARFDNPAHDFPTWIRYRLAGPDRLTACVGDASRERCWHWQRAADLP